VQVKPLQVKVSTVEQGKQVAVQVVPAQVGSQVTAQVVPAQVTAHVGPPSQVGPVQVGASIVGPGPLPVRLIITSLKPSAVSCKITRPEIE